MHEKYMYLALEEARIALEKGDFPVGCVIVGPNGVMARGHRQNSRDHRNELDHAEIVCLREIIEGGIKTKDMELTVYSTMEPCLMCFSTLILNNVRTIVYAYEDVMGGGTNLAFEQLKPLYRNMEIRVVPHILRTKSLKLFQEFFDNKENTYWSDSLLCQYTLAQG